MRKLFSKFAFTAALMLAITFTFSCSSDDGGSNNPNAPSGGGKGGTYKDTRDGKTYKTVKIGTQTWMAENLNYAVAGSKCGTDIEVNDHRDYELSDANTTICDKYGRLYNWATAMGIEAKYNEEQWGGSDVKHQGICPAGWHIPSNDEWETLVNYVQSNECDGALCAGKYLKSKSGWTDDQGNPRGNGEDKYGFSALPSGAGWVDDQYFFVGNFSFWWCSSASEDYDRAYAISVGYEYDNVDFYGYSQKRRLYSIRCVKDN